MVVDHMGGSGSLPAAESKVVSAINRKWMNQSIYGRHYCRSIRGFLRIS